MRFRLSVIHPMYVLMGPALQKKNYSKPAFVGIVLRICKALGLHIVVHTGDQMQRKDIF